MESNKQDKKFGLFIWPEDTPIGGNIFNLSVISHPRKIFLEYLEGDHVEVKYPGFGIVPGIIAKISDDNGKKELEKVLKSSKEFNEVVKKYIKLPSPAKNLRTCSTPSKTPRKSPVTTRVQTPRSPVKTPVKTQRKPSVKTPIKDSSAAAQKRKNARKASEKKHYDDEDAIVSSSPSKKQKEELKRIAQDLTFTELLLPDTSFSLTQTKQTVKPVARRLEKPPSEVLGDSLRLLNMGNDAQNNTDMTDVDVYTECSGACHRKLKYLEGVVSSHQQNFYELNTRLSQCESSLQWAWHLLNKNAYQSKESETTQCNTEVQSKSTSFQAEQPSCSKDERNDFSQDKNPKDDVKQESMFNGFTKEQLELKLSRETCFKRGTTLLFRTMFKEDEYVGRSLTGQSSNKGIKRPGLEDQEKLATLRSIVQNKWNNIPTVLINQVITHLLKPSRLQKTRKAT